MKKIPYKTDQNHPVIRAYKDAVEQGKRNQHVLPQENGWVVKHLGSEKISTIFPSQEKAAQYAQSHAIADTAVFIHGSDGRIQHRKDY
jgi:hypothetical protein